MINKIKEIIKKKKMRNIIIAVFIIFIIILVIIIINNKRIVSDDKNTITYDEIYNMINNKDTFLIYYYNSKSSNKNNIIIKKYLDELGIKYFNYNDVLIDRDEYNKFIDVIDINKEVFGMPALIYIRNGEMYGNIINIDNKELVDKFINNYDLYTIK